MFVNKRKCSEAIGITHCFQQLNTTFERCESNPLVELAQADRLPAATLALFRSANIGIAAKSSLSLLVQVYVGGGINVFQFLPAQERVKHWKSMGIQSIDVERNTGCKSSWPHASFQMAFYQQTELEPGYTWAPYNPPLHLGGCIES
jgi:hypothetical protein